MGVRGAFCVGYTSRRQGRPSAFVDSYAANPVKGDVRCGTVIHSYVDSFSETCMYLVYHSLLLFIP